MKKIMYDFLKKEIPLYCADAREFWEDKLVSPYSDEDEIKEATEMLKIFKSHPDIVSDIDDNGNFTIKIIEQYDWVLTDYLTDFIWTSDELSDVEANQLYACEKEAADELFKNKKDLENFDNPDILYDTRYVEYKAHVE